MNEFQEFRGRHMAAGMRQMVTPDIRWEELEDRLEDECKCESSHRTTVCSGPVTHRITAVCANPFNVCLNSARFHRDMIGDESKRCANCARLCSECWDVRPI